MIGITKHNSHFSLLYQLFYFGAIFILVNSSWNIVVAQVQTIPFNHLYYTELDKYISSSNSNIHSVIKPYYLSNILDSNSCHYIKNEHISLYNSKVRPKNWLARKIFYESFIIIDTSNFFISIDPVINLEYSKDIENDSMMYKNTRGFLIRGNIGKSFAFNSSFYENQAVFPEYISSFVKKYEIIPGSGYAKSFKSNGFDYSMAAGSVIYSPSKTLIFQFGNDKNFIGYGYRSLFLSDIGYNYPFFKTSYTNKKIQVVHLLTSFSSLNYKHSFEAGFLKKYGSFHFINYKPTNFIDIGLFESTLYQSKIGEKSKPYQLYYINPVPLANLFAFGLDNTDNCSVGLNLMVNISKKINIYGQFLLDDYVNSKSIIKGRISDKTAWQSGFKYFDVLGLKKFNLQAEVNSVRPYTYSHTNYLQSYSHYNQSLAHLLNANFIEYLGIMNFRLGRALLYGKFSFATIGRDSLNSNFGSDIFISNNYNSISTGKMLQGIKATIINSDISIIFLINQASNLNFAIGYLDRREKFTSEIQNKIIYVALRTSLNNLYFDF